MLNPARLRRPDNWLPRNPKMCHIQVTYGRHRDDGALYFDSTTDRFNRNWVVLTELNADILIRLRKFLGDSRARRC